MISSWSFILFNCLGAMGLWAVVVTLAHAYRCYRIRHEKRTPEQWVNEVLSKLHVKAPPRRYSYRIDDAGDSWVVLVATSNKCDPDTGLPAHRRTYTFSIYTRRIGLYVRVLDSAIRALHPPSPPPMRRSSPVLRPQSCPIGY